MEKYFSPLSELISSLVEIGSLVETSGPLDQFLVLGAVAYLVLVGSKICIIELLFPRFHVLGTMNYIKKCCQYSNLRFVDDLDFYSLGYQLGF